MSRIPRSSVSEVAIGWNPIDYPVDTFRLAGKLSPGTFEFIGLSEPREWQELNGPGIAGGYLQGGWNKVINFSAKLFLWDDICWSDWLDFYQVIKRARVVAPKDVKALDIWHPLLEILDPPLRAVVVEDVIQPTQQADGLWVAEIKFKSFNKPKVQYVKPDAGKPHANRDPEDVALEQRAATLAEINAQG